ncbi:MAG: DUF4956 domain-containing protein [Bacteroidales bacterium]|jgi:hypothetical protein|nr:DUF4956 domain-containing protein [Bacteroidales bacterium]MCI2146163.1 DUF4956 domain-containing protein [Bacteroidales bacterium]
MLTDVEDLKILDGSFTGIAPGLLALLLRFLLNTLIIWIIIRFFYYPKSQRRDYFTTFMLISISIFLMVFLLGSVKIKVGFALGLFAIFGIIRYRTEQIPIREMTYMFTIIAISVINALTENESWAALLVTNAIFIISIWILESAKNLKHTSCKIILYDKIELIIPDRKQELVADLEKRTGLKIKDLEIGHIDFIKDSAYVKIYYETSADQINTIDGMIKPH